ncbi:hypothetical protein DFH08DRAFT_825259 [Mycena albidolilacea]|uniref:Uncharacterized protein n=1 Tax=Mycena albidolilacea TaxID=1033008 RepID=A0AAD6Z2Z5_9AGAR|nr:hypothetical protein DFH08DRAFT_825259 [Mycena albidolilacea]
MLGTYLGRSLASQGLITDMRKDPGYVLGGGSWLAQVHPDQPNRSTCRKAKLGQNLGRDDEASAHLLALDHCLQSACPFGHHPRLSEGRQYSGGGPRAMSTRFPMRRAPRPQLAMEPDASAHRNLCNSLARARTRHQRSRVGAITSYVENLTRVVKNDRRGGPADTQTSPSTSDVAPVTGRKQIKFCYRNNEVRSDLFSATKLVRYTGTPTNIQQNVLKYSDATGKWTLLPPGFEPWISPDFEVICEVYGLNIGLL